MRSASARKEVRVRTSLLKAHSCITWHTMRTSTQQGATEEGLICSAIPADQGPGSAHTWSAPYACLS